MFGQVSLKCHSKQDAILGAVSKRARHPQKLRSPGLLTKGVAIATPRFGGRTVYLWVKNKTRVWVDKTSVWITHAIFPRAFVSGTLLQAEMYHMEPSGSDSGRWVIAFEDVIIEKGDVVADTKPFLAMLTSLISLVTQLQRCADPAHDPGTFAVKPWFPVKHIADEFRAERFYKQPSYLLLRFLPKDPNSTRPDSGLNKDPFFMRIRHDVTNAIKEPGAHTHTEGKVFAIRKNPDTTDPDQYDLFEPASGKHEGRACVRTMHNSLWIRGLLDNTNVWCRWLKEHSKYEPYAEAIVEKHESHPSKNHRDHSRKPPKRKVEMMLV